MKVIECVPEDERVVFSERAAQSEPGKRAELFNALQPGQNVKGVVTNITDFGVFVDLGGVEGLIHISELSWGRVLHPNQIVKMGSTIDVQVLDLAPERCRVALSLKRLLPNPWQNAAVDFPKGCIKPATITSVLSFGAFARLDAGVEGLIHASEIPMEDGKSLKEILSEGQAVQVRVLHLDPAHQRMGLSMRLRSVIQMPKSSHPRKRQYEQTEPTTPRNDWLEKLASFNLRFGRFLRDTAGVLLIAFAFMSLLAVWGVTDGALLTPFASMLTLWFGWGSFLILFGIGYLGYSLLRRDNGEIHWGTDYRPRTRCSPNPGPARCFERQ